MNRHPESSLSGPARLGGCGKPSQRSKDAWKPVFASETPDTYCACEFANPAQRCALAPAGCRIRASFAGTGLPSIAMEPWRAAACGPRFLRTHEPAHTRPDGTRRTSCHGVWSFRPAGANSHCWPMFPEATHLRAGIDHTQADRFILLASSLQQRPRLATRRCPSRCDLAGPRRRVVENARPVPGEARPAGSRKFSLRLAGRAVCFVAVQSD